MSDFESCECEILNSEFKTAALGFAVPLICIYIFLTGFGVINLYNLAYVNKL